MAATTIKVPSELRDELNERARAAGTSVAGVLQQLLAEHERAEMWRAMREAKARLSPERIAETRALYTDLEDDDPADLLAGDD